MYVDIIILIVKSINLENNRFDSPNEFTAMKPLIWLLSPNFLDAYSMYSLF